MDKQEVPPLIDQLVVHPAPGKFQTATEEACKTLASLHPRADRILVTEFGG